MPNGVRSVRRLRINVSNVNNNNQSQRPQVRRPPTPRPPQPRPVSRNRNLQVPMVTNIRSNSSPVRRRTKSTRSTRRIKGYKDTQSYGKKRKIMVNVAKKSKRASQKKRGRKMSRRQRGGLFFNTPKCPGFPKKIFDHRDDEAKCSADDEDEDMQNRIICLMNETFNPNTFYKSKSLKEKNRTKLSEYIVENERYKLLDRFMIAEDDYENKRKLFIQCLDKQGIKGLPRIIEILDDEKGDKDVKATEIYRIIDQHIMTKEEGKYVGKQQPSKKNLPQDYYYTEKR